MLMTSTSLKETKTNQPPAPQQHEKNEQNTQKSKVQNFYKDFLKCLHLV